MGNVKRDGEREAICLTIELAADLLLIDERAGRLQAVQRGLKVTGTLAVLEEAAQKGLLDFRSTLAAIRKAGFRVSTDVAAEFLRRNP
jgi:predicted nucleic acid-binding protein